MHSRFTVVFDACVLFPASVRNLLLQLATTGLFRARWTDEIHDEWTRNLLAQRPDLDPSKLQATRELMDRAVPDALVEGYESLISGLSLPDQDDLHVLAAALRCHAALIVTTNLKDFPSDVLEPLGVAAQHPDRFVTHLFDLDPATVCEAVKTIRARLHRPPFTAAELIERYQHYGLPETASKLRPHSGLL